MSLLLPPPQGMQRLERLASRLGCTLFEYREPQGQAKAAVLGGPPRLASTFVEFGARWEDTERVHIFASWPMLEAALHHCVAQDGEAMRSR